MAEVLTKHESFHESLAAVPERTGGPAWLDKLHQHGKQQFEQLGFPTQQDEPWRFTNVAPIVKTPFVTAEPGAKIDADALAPYRLGDVAGMKLVFVDGHFRAELSDLRDAPKGLRVMPMSEAIRDHAALLRPHLGQYAEIADGFDALNAAHFTEGVFVHVARNVQVEQPIELLFVASGSEQPVMSHGRNLIVAEPDAKVTVVESYAGPFGGKYLNNAVTEVTVAEQAHVDHYFVERDSEDAFNLTSLRIRQGRDSRFESHTALFGGSIVRNNVIVELAGENCDSTINGLFMGHGSQHMDNYMRVIHGGPNGDSRQFYKGILDDKSHGVFSGRIVVREGAQKTDAKQTNRNLLLSDDATVNTMPQLEIYADDVKCTHGATMGQLSKDAQFYLEARGIDAATARSMLIYAFAGESLERMNVAPIRDELEQLMLDRLPGGAKLKALIQ
ncbi:MAG: Fe-S cluster assembly protein SufD [Phycisphaeraceae bacterium]